MGNVSAGGALVSGKSLTLPTVSNPNNGGAAVAGKARLLLVENPASGEIRPWYFDSAGPNRMANPYPMASNAVAMKSFLVAVTAILEID
jgi:hypothetical protein